MHSSTLSIATAGLFAFFLSGSIAIPLSDESNPIQKRDNVDLSPGQFPNSVGTDLTLCYNPNFQKCTTKTNIPMNQCFNGNGNDLKDTDPKKWTGFTNDQITSFAITGKTPGRCLLYADGGCQQPVVNEKSSGGGERGGVLVWDLYQKYGAVANDVVSSVQCMSINVSRILSFFFIWTRIRY
ncbi:MAG: hypothetical protein Q9222_005144 [Ikaeria aurantiellina]